MPRNIGGGEGPGCCYSLKPHCLDYGAKIQVDFSIWLCSGSHCYVHVHFLGEVAELVNNKFGETRKYIKEGFLLNFSGSRSSIRHACSVTDPKPVLCSSSFVAQRMIHLCCFSGCPMTIFAWWGRLKLCNRKAGSSQAFEVCRIPGLTAKGGSWRCQVKSAQWGL